MTMEYKIVKSKRAQGFLKITTLEKAIESLNEEVNSHIRQGWEPVGGASVATYGSGSYMALQSMVKQR